MKHITFTKYKSHIRQMPHIRHSTATAAGTALRTWTAMLAILLTQSTTAAASNAAEAGDSVLEVMLRVNDFYINNHPDPTTPTFVGRERPSNLWTRGVYFEGLSALCSICPKEEYLDYIRRWGDFHEWKPRNGITTRNADDYCCGQTYIDMYNLYGEDKMTANVLAHANMLVETPQLSDWWWVDALQMGMPYLAKMGRTTGDSRYYATMRDMYMWTRDTNDGGLFNESDGLWWRDPDFNAPYTEPNGADCYWSRGNGWAYAALTRVIAEMKADTANLSFLYNETSKKDNGERDDYGYKRYVEDFRLMSKAIKDCQRDDGFWNCSLHDGTHFGGPETSGTALFVYGLAYGIRTGLIDSETYMPTVTKAWNAIAHKAIHDNGFIGYVQGTGKEPKDGQPTGYDNKPDFDDFATGCVLLAGSEFFKMTHNRDSIPATSTR